MSKLLLPYRFKTIGAVITPLGLALWIAMQLGYTTQAFTYFFGVPAGIAPYRTANIVVAVASFFSFLAGIYFLAFSKEKIEDELVQRVRLDSFQFAAVVQIISVIAGFIYMLFAGDPGENGMMLFFLVLLVVFWLCFIGRFNYVLHVKLK